ncbi:hypothetical protein [Actinophytocola sp. NPDC049390]|uniref:hypothetical protein n=1 Tax=Actinophytocola sp. NPDC049390 TaxID=3363894 RepID=UPI00379AC38F
MTIDQQVPLTTAAGSAADRFDAYYGQLFGWSVRWRDDGPFLALENGLCAVTLPKRNAGPVLDRLAAVGCQGPALTLSTSDGTSVALLADNDGVVRSRTALPGDVTLLDCGAVLPLPFGPPSPGGAIEWLCPPDPRQRWLPTLSAVLASIHTRPASPVSRNRFTAR